MVQHERQPVEVVAPYIVVTDVSPAVAGHCIAHPRSHRAQQHVHVDRPDVSFRMEPVLRIAGSGGLTMGARAAGASRGPTYLGSLPT